MASLSNILEIARRSLTAQRLAINTTGHNISNAGTPGFSRQRVEFAPTDPMRTAYGFVGTGVITSRIGRVREGFIDQQIRGASDTLGSAASQQKILGQVEAVLNEPADNGLSASLNRFYNAFNELALHPEESAYRSNVLQQGTLLSQSFHQLNKNLTQLHGDILNDVNAKVADINRLTKEIGQLDLQIVTALSGGDEPSDLKDKRDMKLDELSKIVRISANEDTNGSMIVSIGGAEVASRGLSTDVVASIENGQVVIRPGNSPRALSVISGSLGGDVEMFNRVIPDYIDKVHQLASAMITTVNNAHRAGFGLGTPPLTGNDFFVGTDAATIDINPFLLTNPAAIATSSDGRPGNNDVALALAAQKSAMVLDGGVTTIPQFYNNLVSAIGSAINQAGYQESTQQLIVTQLENQRNSVSGVSIDEEMTNLIKYQRAFDASARLVSTVDEMMQTIIDLV